MLRIFCVNMRQTRQTRLKPAGPIQNEKLLGRWSLWRSKSNALKCFLLSSLPFGVLPLSYPAALSSPPPHPSLTPSLNELPSDYWGLWRFIRNMCEGLEAADGKSFVLHPNSLPPPAEIPSWWGRKALCEFWDVNLLAFYRIFFSTECINRKKLLTPNHFV